MEEPGVEEDTWNTIWKVCSDVLLFAFTRKTGPSENVSVNCGSENVYRGCSKPIAISVENNNIICYNSKINSIVSKTFYYNSAPFPVSCFMYH